jgi:hypothetical protein
MQRLFIFCCVCLLAGCSHHRQPVDLAKKERLVSELISSAPQCSIYKDKLKSPTNKDDDVDDIFHEALKAHCVYKDV